MSADGSFEPPTLTQSFLEAKEAADRAAAAAAPSVPATGRDWVLQLARLTDQLVDQAHPLAREHWQHERLYTALMTALTALDEAHPAAWTNSAAAAAGAADQPPNGTRTPRTRFVRTKPHTASARPPTSRRRQVDHQRSGLNRQPRCEVTASSDLAHQARSRWTAGATAGGAVRPPPHQRQVADPAGAGPDHLQLRASVRNSLSRARGERTMYTAARGAWAPIAASSAGRLRHR